MLRLALLLILTFSTPALRQAQGQSGTRSMPPSTSANVTKSNPFLPKAAQTVPRSLACQGYCVVSLAREGTWLKGSEKLQATYDNQSYHFADARMIAIFTANPQRYAPVLQGDCLVTFAESQQRVPGTLTEGLVYGERLLFSASEKQAKQFKANPEKYLDADLVLQGHCPVTFAENGQKIVGNADSEITLGGLRYRFADLQKRAQFLSAPQHYQQLLGIAAMARESMPAAPLPTMRTERLTKKAPPALSGYCVVSLLDDGAWQRGLVGVTALHENQEYRFANEAAKNRFLADRSHYVPAAQGHCIVTLKATGKRVPGSVYHVAEYEGKLYLLAGDKEKRQFLAAPEKYLDSAPNVAAKINTAKTDTQKAQNAF